MLIGNWGPVLPYFTDSKTSKLSFQELEGDSESTAQTGGSALAAPICLARGPGSSPPPHQPLRARPSPPPGDTLCGAPEVSGSGPPAGPAAGRAAPANALTSPGGQPLRTGQLDTEGANFRAKISQGILVQLWGQGPTLSKEAGGDSEQGKRQRRGISHPPEALKVGELIR